MQDDFNEREIKCWLPGHFLLCNTCTICGQTNAQHMHIYNTPVGPIVCTLFHNGWSYLALIVRYQQSFMLWWKIIANNVLPFITNWCLFVCYSTNSAWSNHKPWNRGRFCWSKETWTRQDSCGLTWFGCS